MKSSYLLGVVKNILEDKEVSLSVTDFESFKKLKLDSKISTITGSGKGNIADNDNSVECTKAQEYFDEIKKSFV